eukprot:TRINITY_DN17178_c0_g1_i1.p1 TRINITY_DN17178_c0_g1~~TRINITY_DN17178_c0_g1_i1.p1  ORF type:complete len:354 (+),score=118.48 TRINITY_DN17178_c0_g1_i1:140-1063(+)
MKAAYDLGCNFFDNAEVYAAGKAEETMGRCIKRLNVDRSTLVISTKLFWGGQAKNQKGLSRKHIIEGLNKSLARLQLDYVDILFCHRPDYWTPMEEIVRAMNWAIDQGKVFYWGTSEWPAEKITEAWGVAQRLGLIGPCVEQPQYNMFHRTRFEIEYDRLYKEHGLGTTIWSPLGSGLLTGKYTEADLNKAEEGSRFTLQSTQWLKNMAEKGDGVNGMEVKDIESIVKRVQALQPIATELNCTIAQLALAWTIKNPNVSTTITGASKVSQVTENFKALEVSRRITDDVMKRIEDVIKTAPTPRTHHY